MARRDSYFVGWVGTGWVGFVVCDRVAPSSYPVHEVHRVHLVRLVITSLNCADLVHLVHEGAVRA
jgi:hypothetical protein